MHSNTSHVISGAFAALFAGVPHLWQIREILIWKTFFAKPLKYFMNFSTCNVICVSDAALSSFDPPYTMADRVRVISDGIEVDKFLHAGQGGALRASLGFAKDQPLVGLVGRIVLWKGHLQFIEAVSMVHKTHPEARFVVVGEAVTKADQVFEKN